MKTSHESKRRWVTVAVVLALLGTIAVGGLVLAQVSPAGIDEAEIASLIRAFERTEASMGAIPDGAVSSVHARLAELPELSRRAGRGEELSPVKLLPDVARDEINRAWSVWNTDYCSAAWQARHAEDTPLSDIIESGLYNNAEGANELGRDVTELLSVAVMRDDGKSAIVWAYSWTGQETPGGQGGQSWIIQEYRVVREGDAWRIDARRALTSAAAQTDDRGQQLSWGPESPHDSLVDAEQEGESELYPGMSIPVEQLKSLVYAAQDTTGEGVR